MNIIQTSEAPAAIGPYAQGVVAGTLLFTSGQIALRPDGSLLEGDIGAQTRQVLQNLQAIIVAAGGQMQQVIKTTVFLKSLDDFGPMNTVYGQVFASHTPARSTVEVARLPRDVLVEIEAVVDLSAR